MKVQCPNCDTNYSIDDRKIPEKGARAKCKKCGNNIIIKKETTVTIQKVNIVCPNCRKKYPNDGSFIFCNSCGTKLENGESDAASESGQDRATILAEHDEKTVTEGSRPNFSDQKNVASKKGHEKWTYVINKKKSLDIQSHIKAHRKAYFVGLLMTAFICSVIIWKTNLYVISAESQYRLGCKYYFGEGAEQNYNKAIKWFRKAADKGHAEAQNTFGVCYAKGQGVKQDNKKAFEWFKKAAEQDNPRAQLSLGFCYRFGYGVEQDDAKAIELYTKSANQGLAEAQYELGLSYAFGYGVEQDDAKAIELYTKSANQGLAEAQYELGSLIKNRVQVKGGPQRAVEWFRKAAEQGHAKAQDDLGLCYETGYGVERNYSKATEWYKKAAESRVK